MQKTDPDIYVIYIYICIYIYVWLKAVWGLPRGILLGLKIAATAAKPC